ncbi:conserved hypothetical protein [Luminiphilus syltensis NOR5-1B]|uniref:Uncharacterized protein n=1 Tax=Luminiphilus syltensis NOR5-1B TaxID=565045 RepID=B8KWN1_9GAMM|nr:DUF692 domain-containing protein [Luminiphilus syltensis]EED36167.1 conserved hypothetical protein [Luminiphilus syltensis NOR5-1B]
MVQPRVTPNPVAEERSGLPGVAGVGLKPAYFDTVLDQNPGLGFFEVHAENYFVDGGPLHHYLGQIAARYPLSIHGVGLSIGGESAPDRVHLQRLGALLDRYTPALFSEHLAWSSHGPYFYNDLLPLCYDNTSLLRVCEHIDQVQSYLQRPLLLENPSTYIEWGDSNWFEPEFVGEVIQRTGCGLLLDVNNVYVSCVNHGWDPLDYMARLPTAMAGEIHLAGFAEDSDALGDRLLIDDHGHAVANPVWFLYQRIIDERGPIATLIERDQDLPSFQLLVEEAAKAQAILDGAMGSRP